MNAYFCSQSRFREQTTEEHRGTKNSQFLGAVRKFQNQIKTPKVPSNNMEKILEGKVMDKRKHLGDGGDGKNLREGKERRMRSGFDNKRPKSGGF